MSQLHSLLHVLSEDEILLLRSMKLIGKEKEVFDFTQARKELPESDSLLKELGITDTHYYKINSVLLRKAYQALVPGGEKELLQYLRKKNLFHLLRHEILFQQKKHSKATGPEAEAFYLDCFRYLIDFPYKFYDKKLTDLTGEKYLQVKKDCSESDRLYVRYHKLFSEVNRMAARKNPKKALGIGIRDLLKSEAELENTEHYLAKYYLYRSICSFYTYYERDTAAVISYLEKAMQLKDRISPFFPINVGSFLQLLYADALFLNNEVEKAEKIYSTAFSEGINEDMYGYYYHCEQYVLVSVIRKKYDQALHILESVFRPCIESKLDIYATRGAMCFAKYYMCRNELKPAANYLNIAKSINEKTFYLPFDVQLRVLENISFFMRRDYEFALQLANRNIKFLRAQEHPDVFNDYMIFWKMLISFLNAIFKEEKLPESVKQDHDYLDKRYSNLYCDLISRIYQQTQEELVAVK